MRALVECAGIKDILSKSMGSSNQINIVKAAVDGLKQLRKPQQVAVLRGRDVHEVAPKPMLEAVAAADVRLQAARTAALEEVYTDAAPGRPQPGPRSGRRPSMKLKVTQRRSVIDRPKDQKDTVRRLGLHRINDTVIKDDRPEIRGMIAKVQHLVDVEEVEADEAPSPAGPPRARRRTRKRVGRGRAGVRGKTAGRGTKGTGRAQEHPVWASRAGRCRCSAACRSSRASRTPTGSSTPW